MNSMALGAFYCWFYFHLLHICSAYKISRTCDHLERTMYSIDELNNPEEILSKIPVRQLLPKSKCSRYSKLPVTWKASNEVIAVEIDVSMGG